MSQRCEKCQGLIVSQYDVYLRQDEQICINCGARPAFMPVRVDGQAIGAPMVCRTCGIYPREIINAYRADDREIGNCRQCREKALTRKRVAKKETGKAEGNVRYKKALLV